MFGGGPPIGGGPRGGGGGGPMGRMQRSSGNDDLGTIYDNKVIKRLPKYLAPVKAWLFIGAVGMAVSSLAALAAPYLIAVATDNYIKTGNVAGLTMTVMLLLGAAVLVWAGQYTVQLYLELAGQSILKALRIDMFAHLQKLPLSFFTDREVGELMSRVQSDVQQLQQILTMGVLNIFSNILTLAGIACAMLIMNLKLALLTLTIVPALCAVVLIWQRYARIAFAQVRQTIATVNVQFQEGISGVRVTQSLSREEINLEHFKELNKQNLDVNIKATRLMAAMMPTTDILNATAMSLVVIFGGYQVLNGSMGVGVLLGFIFYIQRFFHPIMELTMDYAELQRAMASGARIFELLDKEPVIKDTKDARELPPIKGEIEFNHVRFSYNPEVEVLHDIDFVISPGETVAVVGQTGAGKSSMANLLARFYDVTKGAVTVDGHDVRSITQDSLRRQIGIVPQDPILFSGTIEENIRFGRPDASLQDIITASRMAGAHSFITHLKDEYVTSVGERGGNLSAGQRQLICLARAILLDPAILILDEATSNVDSNTERLMQKSLLTLAEKRTCFIIAHRLSTITNADRIIVLEQGNIAEMGSHQELLDRKGIYHSMFTSSTSQDLMDSRVV